MSQRGKNLPPIVKLSFAKQIVKGMICLHGNGLVWADAKPENVLVFSDSSRESGCSIKLSDFGATQEPETFWNQCRFPEGEAKAGWVSPFSVCWTYLKDDRNDLARETHRLQCFHSDVFCFGLILLWILIGEEEFQKADMNPSKSEPPVECHDVGAFFQDVVKFPTRAESALTHHIKTLRDSGFTTGLSQSDVEKLTHIFKSVLAWMPEDGYALHRSKFLLDRCLPSKNSQTQKFGTPSKNGNSAKSDEDTSKAASLNRPQRIGQDMWQNVKVLPNLSLLSNMH